MSKQTKLNSTIVILIIIIGTILRLYHLGYNDFWHDEVNNIYEADYPLLGWNPPLYYLILHLWFKIVPLNEFTARLPSAVFGLVCLILLYFLGKELLGKTPTLFALFLMVFSPFQIWYSQEVAPYTLLLFFTLLNSLSAVKFATEKGNKYLILWFFSSILGLYTHYYFLYFLALQIIYFLFKFKKIKFLILSLLSFLFFIPWLSQFFRKFIAVKSNFWIPLPPLKSIPITLENFLLGYNANQISYFISLGIILFLIFVAFKKYRLKNKSLNFLLYFSLSPIIFVFLFSYFFFPIYLDRCLIISSPYFYLLLSFVLIKLKRHFQIGIITLVAILLTFSNFNYFNNKVFLSEIHHRGSPLKKPIKPAVEFLFSRYQKGDLIAHTNYSTLPPFRFYFPDKNIKQYYLMQPKTQDPYWRKLLRKTHFTIKLDETFPVANRIWLIASTWQRNKELDENSQAVKEWMDRNYKLLLKKEFDGIFIFKYANIPTK